MFREEVAAFAIRLGALRSIARHQLTGEWRTEALEALAEMEEIILRPNGATPEEQREKARVKKARQRAEAEQRSIAAVQGCPPVVPGDTEYVPGDSVEEEVVEVLSSPALGSLLPSSASSPPQRDEETQRAMVVATTDPKPHAQPFTDGVAHVYAHYRTYHPRIAPALLATSKEYRLIVEALKAGNTVGALDDCIDGYHLSPHHLGANERGTVYLGLGLIFRDATHVANGIRMAAKPDIGPISQREVETAATAARFLSRPPPPNPALHLLRGRQ